MNVQIHYDLHIVFIPLNNVFRLQTHKIYRAWYLTLEKPLKDKLYDRKFNNKRD